MTPSSFVVEIERRIDARPETVFSFFTDPERYRLWQGVDAELDPRPGGVFRVIETGRTRMVARGVFVEVRPPTRLVFTWGWEPSDPLPDYAVGLPPGTSTVEVDLVADGEGTILRLRHSGLPRTEAVRQVHVYGWESTLDRLAVAAGGGDPGPYALAEL